MSIRPVVSSRLSDNLKIAATLTGAFALLLKEGETGFSRLGGSVKCHLSAKWFGTAIWIAGKMEFVLLSFWNLSDICRLSIGI